MIFLRKICLAFDLVLVIYGSQLLVLWDNHILLVHASFTEYSKPLFISAFEQKQARNSFFCYRNEIKYGNKWLRGPSVAKYEVLLRLFSSLFVARTNSSVIITNLCRMKQISICMLATEICCTMIEHIYRSEKISKLLRVKLIVFVNF